MASNKTSEKYLSQYAEKENFYLEDFPREYHNVLIVPAFDEPFDNINELLNSIEEKNSLLILVVNSQEKSSAEEKLSNTKLIEKIKSNFLLVWKSNNNTPITLHRTKNCDLLLVDRSTKTLELPCKTGVGLARKIAADIASRLILENKIKTNWIHCTDADAIPPKNYFSQTQNLKNYSAAIYPYIHRVKSESPDIKKSMLLYDLSLLHYVIGLSFSNSDYSYHSIGSTISFDFKAYCAVRGFPPIESGEDFYILNKLSKIGEIKKIDCEPIIIDGRISSRTPFGTGKSLEKISAMENPELNYLFYNSIIFEKLKLFLNYINDFENKLFSEEDYIFLNKIKNDAPLHKTLDKIGVFTALEIAFKSAKNPELRKKHFNVWFDSFRTLKFVHQMRDITYPSIPLKQLILQPLYKPLHLSEVPALEELLDQFKKLHAHLTSSRK